MKVANLQELPPLDGVAVVADCDTTLFEHGTTTPYPEVVPALAGVSHLALVSAFPDGDLMHARKEILGAEIGLNTDKEKWYKGKLFEEVARQLGEVSSSVVILGDRPVADVWVARRIFERHGFDTLGVRVARPDVPIPVKADYVLRPTFAACAAAVKLSGQDEYIRPRPEQGWEIADSFFARAAT